MPSRDTQAAGGYRPPPLVTFSGALVAHIHTFFGFLAFGGALFMALALHYRKVVKNGIAGWPQEYWPSVSATIGDWYPERNIFQIGIALMSGPRFMLVLLSSLLVSLSKPTSMHAKVLAIVGCLRTFSCGGWVYVTSSDDHDVHDIMMGLYLILTPPWMYITSGSLAAQPNKEALAASTGARHDAASRDALAAKARKMRRLAASAFFGMIPFMVVFFYRHKVLEIPGAYTHYAFFEWGLIIFDLLFDCAAMYDLSRLEIQVVEAQAPAVAREEFASSQPLISGTWVEGGTHEAISRGAWSTPPAALKTRRGSSEKKLHHGDTSLTLSSTLSFASKVYIGYLFWTTLTALHPEIFFFSVYNMGIGGHEVLLVIQLIGLGFALIPPVQRWLMPGMAEARRISSASKRAPATVGKLRIDALIVTYIFCLLGLVVWPVKDALVRLIATALSCVGFSVLTALSWGRAWELNNIEEEAATFLLGLSLSSLSKYANHSNNPAWPILNSTNGGLNFLALALAIAAVIHQIHEAQSIRPLANTLAMHRREGGPALKHTAAVLSLGALLFILHVALSDSGTLIAWTWTGYPIKGPMAITHGWLVIAAVSASTVVSLFLPTLALSHGFWAFGALSLYVAYAFENWMGFAGALGTAIFLPPLTAPLIRLSMEGHPLKTMWLVWLVTDLMAFLQVLTAAYAFVPGGKIMREKLWFMLLATTLFLTGGLASARSQQWAITLRRASPRLRRLTALAAAMLSLAALLVPAYRKVPSASIVPSYPRERVFGAGIWTVHFALDQSMQDSSRRMAAILGDLKLDVIGLLESDLHRTVFGNRDLTQYLAEELGMYADIGPGPDKHTWGAALLSRFPIVNSTHHLLPSPNGELAPAIHAVLDIYGILTHVIVSHNGQEEDPLDRELQTTEIARILREAYPHPAVFLGYVVTKPHAKRPNPYEILFSDGRIQDVDPSDTKRWCQYIGFRALERVAYARVSRYSITDTELQTAKFRVPPAGKRIDADRDVLPTKTFEEPPSVSWLYPRTYVDPTGLVYA